MTEPTLDLAACLTRTEPTPDLGALVRLVRRLAGRSTTDVAQRAGMPVTRLWLIEHSRRPPTEAKLHRIVQTLLGRVEPTP